MQSINLQIAPGAVNPVINVSQNDVGRQFQLKLYDGAAAYTLPTGTTASIEGIKPDGHAFSYSDAVSVSGSILTVTTKLQMTVVAGRVICEIRLRKSGLDLGSLNFVMLVEESPINENVDPSDTEIPAIIELAEGQVEDAEAWARGTKNGEPVPSTDPQFQNNAKWYAEHVAASLDALSNVNISSPVNEDILEYNSTTHKWKNSGAVRQLKQALSDEVTTRAKLGAHNFLQNKLASQTNHSVVLQTNDDETTDVSGSIASGDGNISLDVNADVFLPAGTYILSGIPSGIQAGYGYVQAFATTLQGGDLSWADRGPSDTSLATKTFAVDTHIKIKITFYASHEQTFDFTYKPMIRLATDADETYRPYVPTNSQLLSYKDNSILGAKNRMPLKFNSRFKAINNVGTWSDNVYTRNGGTFTINTDDKGNVISIKINGTFTTGTSLNFFNRDDDVHMDGAYTLNGISGGSSQSYYLALNYRETYSGTEKSAINLYDGEATTIVNSSWYLISYLYVLAGTYSNIYVRPMIRLASDTDPTYQPYAKTNRELTEVAQQVEGKYALIGGDSISVTADGVKTYAELLTELFTVYASYVNALDTDEAILLNSLFIQNVVEMIPQNKTGFFKRGSYSGLEFGKTVSNVAATSYTVNYVYAYSSNSIFSTLSITSSGNTLTSKNSDVMTSGHKITLNLFLYKQIS